MTLLKNLLKSLLLMVIVSVVLSALLIFSLVVCDVSDSSPYKAEIGPYFRSLILLIVTRCLPMIPILFMMYLIGRFILKKYKLSIIPLIFIFFGIYIILGLSFFGGNFWQIHNLYSGDFGLKTWFKSELRDLFFSISSLIGSIYFVWKSFYSDKAVQHRQY